MAWFGSHDPLVKGTPTTPPKYHALAPAPVSLLGATPPPDLNLAASDAQTAALAAAKKQRKKAGAGGTTLLTTPAAGVQAATAPKSLLGI